MTADQLILLLGSGGGGALLLALCTGAFKWLNGSAGRERIRNSSLEGQRLTAVIEKKKAERRAGLEFRMRLDRERQLARQDRVLINAGIAPEPWTDFSSEIDELDKLDKLDDAQ